MPGQPSRDPLTEQIIGAAIEVHRALGPGLLESTYEQCLAWELEQRGADVRRQVALPVVYKNVRITDGYRLDLLVDDIVVEVKGVDRIHPIHEAQLLTYMRLSGMRTGLLLNFHTALLRDGIRRFRL
jgi:GxxExxY protein